MKAPASPASFVPNLADFSPSARKRDSTATPARQQPQRAAGRTAAVAPVPGAVSATGQDEQESQEVARLKALLVASKEEFLATNRDVVVSNTRLLQTISAYEKRYMDLLADRERAYQTVAQLQRKVAQLQGERDALAKTLPDLLAKSVQAVLSNSTSFPAPAQPESEGGGDEEKPQPRSSSKERKPRKSTVGSSLLQTTPVMPAAEVPTPSRTPNSAHKRASKEPARARAAKRKRNASSSSSNSRHASKGTHRPHHQ